MTTQVKDAFGVVVETLPELNYELLNECVAWAWHSSQHPTSDAPVYWDQGAWAEVQEENRRENTCKTSFCISGYANLVTGHSKTFTGICEYCGYSRTTAYPEGGGELCTCDEETRLIHGTETVIRQVNLNPLREQMMALRADDEDYGPDCVEAELDASTGNGMSDDLWFESGAVLLGLTRREASKLFNGNNTIEKVLKIANQIAAHRGYPNVDPERWELRTGTGGSWLVETETSQPIEVTSGVTFAAQEWASTFAVKSEPEESLIRVEASEVLAEMKVEI